MGFLDNTGLTDVLTRIKAAFVKVSDTQAVGSVGIDNAPIRASNNLVKSGGAYSAIHPDVGSSQPITGLAPGMVYDLGTLTGTVTFALATPTDNSIPNAYYWTFETGSTAPTINWPNGITWPDNFTPSIDAGKHYEVFVRNGYASMLVYTI